MFSALLVLQWRSARAWLVAGALAVACLPVISVGRSWPDGGNELAFFLAELDAWSLFYPVVALILGFVTAGLAWRDDRRGGFVYALTLPIGRSRYVGYRFGAGLLMLGGVGLVLWLAAVATVMVTRIPGSLRSYPGALALKFSLLAGAAFAMAFVFMGLPDGSKRILGRAVATLIAVQILVILVGWDANWLPSLVDALSGHLGPFALIGGRWMLVDV